MILTSPDKQFSLNEDGQILFQPDPSNPQPGTAVARVSKGEGLLKPQAALADAALFEGQDTQVILDKLQEWLTTSIHLALEPLFRLPAGDDHTEASQAIADSLYESLGILTRDDIQSDIDKLDEAGRKALRARKVRMGPVIIYMPDLNKPAAIKLRAMLLTLWADQSLPAQTPPDGMVSMPLEGREIDTDFYSKIGYPVYGPRAIRVDMADRVICAVYDGADKGVFKAEHKMAEWLGCNIPDLYAVLEAMGHTKISDPLDDKIKAQEEIGELSTADEPAAPVDAAAETQMESAEGQAEEKATPAVRPELATFRLKRNKPLAGHKPKKPFKKDGQKEAKKPDKKKFKGKPRDRKDHDGRERIYSAQADAKPEDNPFAVLQQLKTGNEKK